MKKIITVFITGLLLSSIGCVPPGQIKKQTAPGQIQKGTGYNPASGKFK